MNAWHAHLQGRDAYSQGRDIDIATVRGGGAGPADRAAAGPIFLIVGGGAPGGLEHVGR